MVEKGMVEKGMVEKNKKKFSSRATVAAAGR
jgi:hypothetical protein